MSSAFLSVHHAEKRFVRKTRGKTTELHVLDDVSWTAQRGQFVTIIGPSGCGKSTLLNAIAGLQKLDGGEIMLDGHRVEGPGEDRAVIFQHASLLPWRTIRNNVAYGLQLRRSYSRTEIKARAEAALAQVGLLGFEGHYPHELSGGMQPRANRVAAELAQLWDHAERYRRVYNISVSAGADAG